MKSTRNLFWLSLSILVLTSSTVPAAKKKPPRPSDTPLEISVTDLAGLNIGSDGRGPYINGGDNVEATIVGAGNFRMDTRRRSGRVIRREVFFDFAGCGAPPIPDMTPVFMSTTGCGVIPRDMSTTGDDETLCNLNFRLRVEDKPDVEWLLRFNPDLEGPVADKVRVTCTADDSAGQCAAWTIDSRAEHEAVLVDPDGGASACAMPVQILVNVSGK